MSVQFKINRKTQKMKLSFTYDYGFRGIDIGDILIRNWVHKKFNHTDMDETFDSVEYQRVMDEFFRKVEWKVNNHNSSNPSFNNSTFKNYQGGDGLDMYNIKNGIWEGLDCWKITEDLIKELDEKEWNGEDIKPMLGGYEFLGLRDKEEQIKEMNNWGKNLELTKERKRRVEELEQQINSLKDKIRDTEVV